MKTSTFLLLILFLNLGYAQSPDNKRIIPSILDTYKDSLKLKRFGIGALVRHDNITETYAIGIAGDSLEMTPDKVFNIGSLTKTFTSVLIMQEVEKGTISLSDSLVKYFPQDMIKNDNVDLSITIEQLLRHRSGLGEVLIDSIANSSLVNPHYEYNHVSFFNKIPKPLSLPGEKYEYNNSNYLLLGSVLEFVTNRSYHDLLRERIFEPAGMNNSYGYYSPSIKNAAHPMFEGVDYANYVFYNFYKDVAYSAGGIASTLKDLELFFIHLYEKELFIKKETLSQMLDTDSDYGLGISIFDRRKDLLLIGHDGDNFSFSTRNYYNTKTGDLVITFSNLFVPPYLNKITNQLGTEIMYEE
ncbi:serine hydrolase domain-containing protein [Nonlabens sp. Asnod3-A02]|uniref:serine hydrolase domain-containing protein n=1 Tax=Nonlabens sp. Asnod3-A02 TaxID=3160579 RepID=UPI00386CB29C